MNLGKVKTFLIVLFLGINIYLVIALFLSTTFYIDSETIDSTIEILSTNKIEVDKDLIMKSVKILKTLIPVTFCIQTSLNRTIKTVYLKSKAMFLAAAKRLTTCIQKMMMT